MTPVTPNGVDLARIASLGRDDLASPPTLGALGVRDPQCKTGPPGVAAPAED